MRTETTWAGVDVGGRRKGYHCAVLAGTSLLELTCLPTPASVVDRLVAYAPVLTAIDGPMSLALDGDRSRRCERDFVKAGICNIRYTPDRAGFESNPTYYEWVNQRLALYEACRDGRLDVVECFPTASWTVWAGSRGSKRRSRWSREALLAQNLRDLPRRMNQDNRDAIAAALTARAHHHGRSRRFGEIVVPSG